MSSNLILSASKAPDFDKSWGFYYLMQELAQVVGGMVSTITETKKRHFFRKVALLCF